MTKLEISYNSIKKAIEKLEIRIEKEVAKQEKKIEKAKKLNVYYETFGEWVQFRDNPELGIRSMSDKEYNAVYVKPIELRELEILENSLKLEQKRLTKIEDQVIELQGKRAEIELIKCNAVETFLDKWLEDAIQYYDEKGLLTDTPNYNSNETSRKDLKLERDRKGTYIYSRVYEAVGKVVDGKGLDIADDGNINGIIEGEKGKCTVQTIIAGGYNIQCLHFRLLVNKI